jgi:hypothetical protein
MSDSGADPAAVHSPDDEVIGYQSVSKLAVASLLLGLLSCMALISVAFWAIPVAGLALGGMALTRIRRDAPLLIGARAAWGGIFLSVLLGAAATADWLAYRSMIRGEARQVADQYFQYLRQKQPQLAFQFMLPAGQRVAPGPDVWKRYYDGSDQREGLEGFVAKPEVQTILTQGPKALIRYYDYQSQSHDEDADQLNLVYAVTLDDAGKKTSFFIGLAMERKTLASYQKSDWQIHRQFAGIHPDG